jgi:hypothetical protein
MPAVQPDEPTCRMDDIASFRPGVQNGQPYTPAMLKEAAKNFARFSQGDPPHYVPFLSINHDDVFAFGRISDVTYDEGDGVLKVSGENIPLTVGKLVNSGQLQASSIEFFLPQYDSKGKPVEGFRDQNNNVVGSLVIKCLTFLGNQPPAVKGLGPLPTAYFSDRFSGVKLAKFSGAIMDRNAMIEALKAAGVPTDAITDAVPDEVLRGFLEAIQKASMKTDDEGTDLEFGDDEGKDKKDGDDKMVEPGMKSADYMVNDGSSSNQDGQKAAMFAKMPDSKKFKDHSTLVVKFSDEAGRVVTGTLQDFVDAQQATLKGLRANAKAIRREQTARLDEMKKATIKVFLDEMTTGAHARLAPVQRPTFEKLLMKCDHVEIRKFSDNAPGTGTELEDAMRAIRSGPVVRTFGDKLADGMTTYESKMTPERRKELLGFTEQGRVALQRDKQGK